MSFGDRNVFHLYRTVQQYPTVNNKMGQRLSSTFSRLVRTPSAPLQAHRSPLLSFPLAGLCSAYPLLVKWLRRTESGLWLLHAESPVPTIRVHFTWKKNQNSIVRTVRKYLTQKLSNLLRISVVLYHISNYNKVTRGNAALHSGTQPAVITAIRFLPKS